ncbi:MAG: asparaginase [Candidatus Thorarchaeota archaeon]
MRKGRDAQVALLNTGGTIGSIYDPTTDSLRPGLSVKQLLKSLPKSLGHVEVITREVMELDSANAQPHHWQKIASAIKAVHDEFPDLDGIVITHGTDTMVYTASAVSFMVQDFGKPIVFTGAQIPLITPWSDGPRNLLDAIRVAAFADLGETCIVFNGEVHRPTRTKKMRSDSYDAFDSVDPAPLGTLGRDIVLFERRSPRHNLVPRFDIRLDDRVFLLKVFPGLPPGIISRIVDMGYHGIVIEGFGTGNIPSEENSLANGIQHAINQGCFVIVSSQCAFGQTDLSLYAVGRSALDVGAMSAYDMTSEATLVKLAWVLGHTHDPAQVRKMMSTDYFGEMPLVGQEYALDE